VFAELQWYSLGLYLWNYSGTPQACVCGVTVILFLTLFNEWNFKYILPGLVLVELQRYSPRAYIGGVTVTLSRAYNGGVIVTLSPRLYWGSHNNTFYGAFTEVQLYFPRACICGVTVVLPGLAFVKLQ